MNAFLWAGEDDGGEKLHNFVYGAPDAVFHFDRIEGDDPPYVLVIGKVLRVPGAPVVEVLRVEPGRWVSRVGDGFVSGRVE